MDYSSIKYSSAPLCTFAVTHGLVGCTVDHMRALARLVECVKPRMPVTEKPLFLHLARSIIPDEAQEFYDECWENRGKKERALKKEVEESNLTANFEFCNEVLEKNDLEAVSKIVKEARRVLVARANDLQARRSMVGVVAPPRGSDIDIDFAKTLKPAKTQLSKDVVLHWRWKGNFPGRSIAPKTITKVWDNLDGGVSEHDALKIVILTLWGWVVADHLETGLPVFVCNVLGALPAELAEYGL